MMIKQLTIYNSLLLAYLIIMSAPILAQDDSNESRTYSKTYQVGVSPNIEITNKYGQIIVQTWDKTQVKVEAKVTAFGKTGSAAEKILDRVEFDFSQINNYVILETVFDRKSGFFKDLLNNIGDYSKTLLSKNRLAVDYEVFIPTNAILRIDNKFGDVFISNLENNCTISVSNGNLKARDIPGMVRAEISFGNAYFNSINKGELNLKVADVEINASTDLNINSSSSEIEIYDANKIRLNSRNDKLKIKKVNHVYGKSSFSKIEVGTVIGIMDLDMSYGFLTVLDVDKKFNKIDLKGQSTDFNLTFNNKSYFNAALKAKEDDLSIPKRVAEVKVDYENPSERIVSVVGTIGEKNPNPAYVNIDAQKGDLKIFFTPGQ